MQYNSPMTYLRSLDARLKHLASQLASLPQALRLVHTAARGWTLAWLALLVLQGLLPAATIALTRAVVDGLVALMRSGGGWPALRPVLIAGGLMGGAMVLAELLQAAAGWVRANQTELIQDHVSGLIHAQAAAVDYAFYESPEYFDQLYRARNDAGRRALSLLDNLSGLLQNGITLLALAGVLIPYGAWLPLVLLVGTLPALYVVMSFNRRYHRWWEKTTVARRWAQYYDTILTENAMAAEIRLFDLSGHFRREYQRLRQHLRTAQLQQTRRQLLGSLGIGIGSLALAGLVMLWMATRALRGLITLGDMALFYQVFNRGQMIMRSLVTSISQIYSDSLFLGNLFQFLALAPQIHDPARPIAAPAALQVGIRFRGVSFCYPHSERTALQDFDMFIPAGKVVAIVGENGAGKSTLLKLLCRFYDPQVGQIEWDGCDIRDFALARLRRDISVLFQWPVPYQASASQNIAQGDLSRQDDQAAIERAATAAGAHEFIRALPYGYDTMLGKWFEDGAELSAGQWQRVALARAYLRDAPVLVLDEPTSFMDSWSETDWFERFRQLATGRTAVVITHRFTIAMRADLIHVVQKGRVVESGTHAQLVARGGLYAASWADQTEVRREREGAHG
jgi:ATP-binding cassette, subfamily B, bacterial